MSDCATCEVRDHVKKLEEKYSESRRRIYERLEKIETESGRIDERYKNIMRDLEELKKSQAEIIDRIDEIAQKPGERWNSVVSSGITAMVGSVLGYIFAKMFGGS